MNKRKITFNKPNYKLFIWIGYDYILSGNRSNFSKNANFMKKGLKIVHRDYDLKKKGKRKNAN